MTFPAKYTPSIALSKLRKYCSYQDRSHFEIKKKLEDWGFPFYEANQLVVHLIEEGFLNEERFARSYVRGRFRMKGWGRNKIRQGLKQRYISDNLVDIAFQEIDEQEYEETLRKTIAAKRKSIKTENEFVRDQKLAQFAIQRGFEPSLVWEYIKEIKD
ncbi:MAG: regulatory protein RecX [Bacteroidia bacterium]